MTLVIDLLRALREPEYRDEVSEELEGDVTDMVRLEAADEIERLRAVNAELVREAKKLLDLIPSTLKGRLGDGLRVAVARAKEDT